MENSIMAARASLSTTPIDDEPRGTIPPARIAVEGLVHLARRNV